MNRERTFWVYRHPLFHRDRPFDLHLLRRRTCPGVDGRKVSNSTTNPSTTIVQRENSRHANEEDAGGDLDMYCEEEKSFSTDGNKLDDGIDGYGLQDENQTALNETEGNMSMAAASSTYRLKEPKVKRRHSHQIKQQEYKNHLPYTAIDSDKVTSKSSTGESSVRKRRKSWHLSFPKRAVSDEIKSEISFDCGTVLETPTEEFTNDKGKSSLYDDMQLDLSQPEETDDDTSIDQFKRTSILTSLDRRQNKIDSVEQSQLVSQIAQQLQARMKRAEEERNYRFGKHRGGRGRKAERNFYGDTMKYHALTYDDEIFDEIIEESTRHSAKKKSSSSTKVAAPVVTDDSSDSSEDDIASLHSSTSKKNLVANLRYLSIKKTDVVTPSPFPIRDPNVAAHIYQKLLFELGNIPATVIHFCLMTSPALEAQVNLKQMLHANPNLAMDFEHYRSALVPHTCPDGFGNETSRASSNATHFHTPVYNHSYGRDSGKGILRDFSSFALNSMDLLFSNPTLMDISEKDPMSPKSSLNALNREQASVVQLCAKVWYDSSHIFS